MNRINRIFAFAVCVLLLPFAGADLHASGPEAYAIFDSKGKKVEFSDMVKVLGKGDVVFFGEHHNCPIAHWMELEVGKRLVEKHGGKLVVGLEMLEADNQLILDEYMKNLIPFDNYLSEMRMWANYESDYAPVVMLAKENGLKVVATNVPRRYAAQVRKGGVASLEKLPHEARAYLPPFPIEFIEGEDNGAFTMMQLINGGDPEDSKRLMEAQALKDAVMGWFIAQNLDLAKGGKFYHLNGNYHSDFMGGIIPYLLKYKPEAKVVTICTVRQDSLKSLDEENMGRADFCICVPYDMPMNAY